MEDSIQPSDDSISRIYLGNLRRDLLFRTTLYPVRMANRVAREIISYFIATAGDLIAKYSTRFLAVPSGPTEIGISSV
jgi:hypothetical protein